MASAAHNKANVMLRCKSRCLGDMLGPRNVHGVLNKITEGAWRKGTVGAM